MAQHGEHSYNAVCSLFLKLCWNVCVTSKTQTQWMSIAILALSFHPLELEQPIVLLTFLKHFFHILCDTWWNMPLFLPQPSCMSSYLRTANNIQLTHRDQDSGLLIRHLCLPLQHHMCLQHAPMFHLDLWRWIIRVAFPTSPHALHVCALQTEQWGTKQNHVWHSQVCWKIAFMILWVLPFKSRCPLVIKKFGQHVNTVLYFFTFPSIFYHRLSNNRGQGAVGAVPQVSQEGRWSQTW